MAIADITKPIALDETLQATNTALALLGKDTTLQSIATALASMGVNTVGNLASLVTTDKTSLVGAVNEVAGDVDDLDTAKADKVDSATSGNLASLDASGNLADSGWASDKTTTAVSGNPINITGLKTNQLAKNPIITLEPIQAGSGDPSPSNIRAISGRDKLSILSGNKNLCGDLIDNSVIVYNTGEAAYNSSYMCTDFVPIKAHTHYTITNASPGQENWVYHTDRTPWTRIVDGYGTSIRHLYTNGDGFIRCSYQKSAASENTSLQIEVGQESTDYVPYNPQITFQFGQTVYGGTIDLENGVLRVDRECTIFDGSLDEGWANAGSLYPSLFAIQQELTNCADDSVTYVHNAYENWFSSYSPSIYYEVDNAGAILHTISYDKTHKYVYCNYGETITLENFKTYLASHPLQICYELATPYTIQLTPHEISLLKDYAYISTNGTSMSFSYHNGEMASLADVSQLGETVNNLLNNQTAIISASQDISYLAKEHYLKIGNIINLSCEATGTFTNGSYTNIGTIAYKPINNMWFPLINAVSGALAGTVLLTPEGLIRALPSVNGLTKAVINLMFIANQ